MTQEFSEVHEKVFDLSDNRDLTEIERICSRKDKYDIKVDETLMLPFRHIRYEVKREEPK
jgi:hypothetical protein